MTGKTDDDSHELTGTEEHPDYRRLEYANTVRQLHFLETMVTVVINLDRGFLSQSLIKALNYHSIACLHVNAGEYRPCKVCVGEFVPPESFLVNALMDDFVNIVNANWTKVNPFVLSAYVLWRLNYIHPFINGNGRTARASCYFVLCIRAGGWLPGNPVLPVLLKEHLNECIRALQQADDAFSSDPSSPMQEFLSPLISLIQRLMTTQLSS